MLAVRASLRYGLAQFYPQDFYPQDCPRMSQTHFGYRSVSQDEKTQLVKGVFASVARRYDLMNDLMSGGVHRLWKDSLVRRMAPRPGQRVLDLAGGTGDVAFRLAKGDHAPDVVVCDINEQMVSVGRDRGLDRGLIDGIEWTVGNAESLPFEDDTFDSCCIAFGLRNVTQPGEGLAEIRRVLRPGGRFFCLEFSKVVLPGIDKLYDAYSFSLLPKIGKFVARDEASYRYLAESIRQFPDQEGLAAMMRRSGMANVSYESWSGGIVALHCGQCTA
jgi:demethylmenaquinone methyltransferase/2-methoxy-6-polyprenyl-1,4-benzoquinol methylase